MNLQSQYKLEDIYDNPFQGRTEYTDIDLLGRSIAIDDLKEFPRARMNGNGVQLQFGHRRREAFKWLKANYKTQGLPDRYEGYTVMPIFIDDLDDEAMFRSAVIENEHRKELNPIEQAEMMRVYRDQFKKTSDEIGALFGMNGATVRGLIRLMDLPKTLQAQVASGEITQGAARKLLTLQRVDKSEVKNIADTLKNNKYLDAEELIAETLSERDGTIEMWMSYHGDTPLAGHGLWEIYLPIEKFPTQYLPALTAAEVAKSLQMEFTADLRAKIEDYIASIQANPQFASTLAGQAGTNGDLAERISHLLTPPACGACPLHVKNDGDHFCTLRVCHARKTKAWKENIERGICKKLGISMYQPKVDGKDYLVVDDRNDWGKKLLAGKDRTDLRLKEQFSYTQTIDGVPSQYSVIVVGETLRVQREAVKSKVAPTREEQQINYELQRKTREARMDAMNTFLWNEAVPAFEPLLEGLTVLPMLEKLADRWGDRVPGAEPGKNATKAEKARHCRRVLVFSHLDDELPTWSLSEKRNAVGAMAKHLQGLAASYGIKLPKNFLEKADEADKGVAAALAAVAAETKGGKKK